MAVVLAGTGRHLTERVVPSAEIEAAVGRPAGWAAQRVGILARPVADPEVRSWHLAAAAGRAALADAGISAAAVDLLLVHASVPELYYPDVAWYTARDLGIPDHAAVLGLRAACAGFLAGLRTAEQFLLGGGAPTVLLICTERRHAPGMRYTHSAVLFGDGAGAAVLRRDAAAGGGLRGVVLGQRADRADRAVMANPFLEQAAWSQAGAGLTGEGMLPPLGGDVAYWDGPDIFQSAVLCMGEATERVLAQTGLSVGDIDHFLYHQANHKILKSRLRNFDIPPERAPTNIAEVGNISSATVPVLLDEGRTSGRIRRGELVLMGAFGVGYTYGAAVLEV